MRLRLPPLFWNDHANRDLPCGEVVHKASRYVEIEADDTTIDEIRSDASYYADPSGGPDSYEGRAALMASARATIRAIDKARAKGAS